MGHGWFQCLSVCSIPYLHQTSSKTADNLVMNVQSANGIRFKESKNLFVCVWLLSSLALERFCFVSQVHCESKISEFINRVSLIHNEKVCVPNLSTFSVYVYCYVSHNVRGINSFQTVWAHILTLLLIILTLMRLLLLLHPKREQISHYSIKN